jgi:hypothetical protein
MMGAVTGAAMWGCCGSSSTVNVNVNQTTYNGSNVYNSWSKTTVTSGDKSATAYRGPNSAVVTNNQNNNVYASHDGNVYKKQDGQWEKWDGGGQGWQPVQTPQKSQSSAPSQSAPGSSSGQPGAQRQSAQNSQGPGAQQPSAQNPGAQRQSGQRPSSEGLGSERAGSQGSRASRFQGGQGPGGQPFGSRFSGGTPQGLDRESEARDRGFERFSGGGLGGGFHRR